MGDINSLNLLVLLTLYDHFKTALLLMMMLQSVMTVMIITHVQMMLQSVMTVMIITHVQMMMMMMMKY